MSNENNFVIEFIDCYTIEIVGYLKSRVDLDLFLENNVAKKIPYDIVKVKEDATIIKSESTAEYINNKIPLPSGLMSSID